jgi:acyl-coenzyme A synthetase/AMP-(fatty) acid ligase
VPQLPLTDRAAGDVLFRRLGTEVTREDFLLDVMSLAERLPPRRYALNLCSDRYHFLVGFAAALVRGQVSLLSSDRSPHRLEQLAAAYPQAYTIGGGPDGVIGFDNTPVILAERRGRVGGVPQIPAVRTAAIVFTSGSTGEPVPHVKPWAALVACSRAAAARFGFTAAAPASITGMVPPQHMYGFETTVLLPLHAPVSSFAGSTFFPHDVAQALTRVPEPRVLVTTPLQIRTLLSAPQALPAIAAVISATAPLAAELAQEAEAAWQTRVMEIFGATEVGSIASRRTVEGDHWTTYRTVRLRRVGDEGAAAEVQHLPEPIRLADRVEVTSASSFQLLGREADTVKVAGKRASLAGLNAILGTVEGVEDGVFFAPDDLDSSSTARLSAFVVAPGHTAESIAAALRTRIEAPFLPRRVILLDALPRNELGKLVRARLAELHGASVRRAASG